MDTNIIMDKDALHQCLEEMARQIIDHFQSAEGLVIIGIRSRGIYLAVRLQKLLSEHFGEQIPVGVLDITLYRDDLSQLASQPIVEPTDLPFDISDKKIVLIDDVIYTGRTVRAALDQLIDFGRPIVVRLGVVVDRGWREYPIRPDFVGKTIDTKPHQIVQVRLNEIDGEDCVKLIDAE